ncbi:thioesterase family protein [Halorubellus litoreus]|uniref:Acyl-CoA thioesterase n=1 Tax=Halorubellus litoreus TaxID=755308 RepID=A0ABD5VL46_9EURY
MAFEFETIVRAGDTDVTGSIYTPQVVDWLARGLHDIRSAAGYSYGAYEEMGIASAAVNVNVDYLAPIRMEDTVTVAMTPDVGETSIRFDSTGTVEDTRVFQGSITLAFIDAETRDAVRIPDDLRAAFETFAADTTTD